MIQFEGYDKRIKKVNAVLESYGIKSLEDAQKICLDKGIDAAKITKATQMIAFDNALWAYTVGVAIAIKKGITKAADAARAIGIGLQRFACRAVLLSSVKLVWGMETWQVCY